MIEIKNLKKEFTMYIRGGTVIPSFTGVSFKVEQGKLLAVTGPSGIGKSSLLKCIYRTYLPTEGEILYEKTDGSRIDLAKAEDREIIEIRHQEMGYVSQFFHVLP